MSRGRAALIPLLGFVFFLCSQPHPAFGQSGLVHAAKGAQLARSARPSIISGCTVVQVPGGTAGPLFGSLSEVVSAMPRVGEARPLRVLAIDIGGTRIKFMVPGETPRVRFDSSEVGDAPSFVDRVLSETRGWDFDGVAIGYPGAVDGSNIIKEPNNLGDGWMNADFASAFDRPVAVVNDAAMQAMGTFEEGHTLFMGLGTGFGAALVRADGYVLPLEFWQLRYTRKKNMEDVFGKAALERLQDKEGNKKGFRIWSASVVEVAEELRKAVNADRVVFGGGNGRRIDPEILPDNFYLGRNDFDAYEGGRRIFQDAASAIQGIAAEPAVVDLGVIPVTRPWDKDSVLDALAKSVRNTDPRYLTPGESIRVRLERSKGGRNMQATVTGVAPVAASRIVTRLLEEQAALGRIMDQLGTNTTFTDTGGAADYVHVSFYVGQDYAIGKPSWVWGGSAP